MRYALTRNAVPARVPQRGLGAVRVDSDSPFVEWFDREQHAAWCQMYPLLLEVNAAGQRAAQNAMKLRQIATTPAVSMVLPDLALDIQARAEEQESWARRAKQLADYLYGVKDYVLGAEFGAEGWAYESWCRQHGFPLKTRQQLLREIQQQRGVRGVGLGLAPLVLVGGAVTLAYIVYKITECVENVAAGRRYQEALTQATVGCTQGNKSDCKRAEMLTEAQAKEKLIKAEKDDPWTNAATSVRWVALAALGFFALKAFSSSKYAVKREAETST